MLQLTIIFIILQIIMLSYPSGLASLWEPIWFGQQTNHSLGLLIHKEQPRTFSLTFLSCLFSRAKVNTAYHSIISNSIDLYLPHKHWTKRPILCCFNRKWDYSRSESYSRKIKEINIISHKNNTKRWKMWLMTSKSS